MTLDRDDDALPDRVREAARGYRVPPPTPREEMWAAIVTERERRRHARLRARPVRWGLALAATLVLGIGIGRLAWRERPPTAPHLASRAAGAEPGAAYQVAAAQYLARTEVLLTAFRAESGKLDPQFLASARELLTTTRLMLDSPAARDQHLAGLLQDLELVLAEIAQLPAESARRGETDLITQEMTQSRVLPRLRAETAAGSPARTQGVL